MTKFDPQITELLGTLCEAVWLSLTQSWLKIHMSPWLTIEFPVAQWFEDPTKSWRLVGSNPIWNSDFLQVSISLYIYLSSCISKHTHLEIGWLDLRYAWVMQWWVIHFRCHLALWFQNTWIWIILFYWASSIIHNDLIYI